MRALVWTDAALRDFRDQIRYIAERNPSAARRVRDEIDAAARLLQRHPVGRPGRVSGTYEKSVTQTPYIIAYALDEGAVTVLQVIHGSRDWREGEWPE